MNIELGIGIGGGSLFAPTSSDQLVAYAWASAVSPSVTTSAVIHKTINAVPTNSGASVLSPTVSGAGNATVLSVVANADGSVLIPSVAIAGSISINAVIASSNLDSMIPSVSTIRNVSVNGIVADSIASAGVPTVSTSGVAPTILIQDSFNRADSTTSLGVADTGQTWTVYSSAGATYGISNNQAYMVSNASSGNDKQFAGWDVSVSNVKYTIKLATTVVNTSFLVFRAVSPSSFLMFQNKSSKYDLYYYNGSTWSTLGSAAVTPTNGDVIETTLNGSTISVKINGVDRLSITTTQNQTATIFGFSGHSNVSNRFDDLKIETL